MNYKPAQSVIKEEEQHRDEVTRQIDHAVAVAMKSFVEFMTGRTTKAEVTNQLKSISTPDVKLVVDAIQVLVAKMDESKVDLTPFTQALAALEDTSTDLQEAASTLTSVAQALATLKIEPQIKVPAAQVLVQKPDLQPLLTSVNGLREAFEAHLQVLAQSPAEEPEKLSEHLEKVNKSLRELIKKPNPTPARDMPPFYNAYGERVPAQLTADSELQVSATDRTFAVRIDDVTTANTTYIGKAVIGSATNAAVWQIAKLDTSSGLIKTWADGSASFSKVWDNRATTITYS